MKAESNTVVKENEIKDTKLVIENERKENLKKNIQIEKLEELMKQKDDELAARHGTDNVNHNSEEIRALKDDLHLAKELCSEYELQINNIKEEKQNEVNEVLKAKLKLEDEFRSTFLEKQRLKDTERILIKTFDTLKEYYEGKTTNPSENDAVPNPSTIKCDKCDYATISNEDMISHMRNDHANEEPRIQENPNDRDIRNSQSSKHFPNTPVFYTPDVRKSNGFCIKWNQGNCFYEDRCKFLHEESPVCFFKENCNRKFTGCRFFHEDVVSGNDFLDQRRFSHNQSY